MLVGLGLKNLLEGVFRGLVWGGGCLAGFSGSFWFCFDIVPLLNNYCFARVVGVDGLWVFFGCARAFHVGDYSSPVKKQCEYWI
jgi:hypothetical protein